MGAKIICVHGWGCSPAFWQDLMAHFPKENIASIDLGFLGEENLLPQEQEAIYITHSLGTMWALKKRHKQIKALIAINGFSCFKPFAPQKTLLTMKQRLEKSPTTQMTEFWDKCGIEHKYPDINLNVKNLQEGLDWLMEWDGSSELQALNGPVLSLAGKKDRILPLEAMKKEWHGFPFCVKEDARHALPQTHPAWCAQQIKEFLHGARLEVECSSEL